MPTVQTANGGSVTTDAAGRPVGSPSYNGGSSNTSGGGGVDYTAANSQRGANDTAPISAAKAVAANGGTLSPSLVVTSGQSKTNYNNNVSTMNGANQSLGNSTNTTLPTTGKQTPVYDTTTGSLKGYTQADGSFVTVDSGNSTTGTDSGGSGSSTTNTPGSKNNSDGSTTVTNSDGSSYNIPEGMDPNIAKQLNDNLAAANNDIVNAKTTLDNATALLASDENGTNPAAVAAASLINSQFGVLIQQMQAKNAITMGQSNVAVARYGGLGTMNASFLNDQVSNGLARIATLTTQAQNAVLKSNMAYEAGDLKAFNDATTEYTDAKKTAQTELMNLNTAVNDQVKQNAADIKAAQTLKNQTITNDGKLSVQNGQTLATELTKAGYSEKNLENPEVQKWLQDQATALGISDVGSLQSEVTKSLQGNSSLALKNANINSTIAKRNSTGTKFSTTKVIPNVTSSMESNKDSNGYVAPAGWVKAREIWMSQGGSAATFNSNFKSYLNPDDYTKAGFKSPVAAAAVPQ